MVRQSLTELQNDMRGASAKLNSAIKQPTEAAIAAASRAFADVEQNALDSRAVVRRFRDVRVVSRAAKQELDSTIRTLPHSDAERRSVLSRLRTNLELGNFNATLNLPEDAE